MPKAEFWIVKAQVRSFGFVIQEFLSHGISIPKGSSNKFTKKLVKILCQNCQISCHMVDHVQMVKSVSNGNFITEPSNKVTITYLQILPYSFPKNQWQAGPKNHELQIFNVKFSASKINVNKISNINGERCSKSFPFQTIGIAILGGNALCNQINRKTGGIELPIINFIYNILTQ